MSENPKRGEPLSAVQTLLVLLAVMVAVGVGYFEFKAVGAGYFSGNGNNDIIWQNTYTGECGFYLMNGTTVSGWAELGTIPTQWQIQY